MDLGCVVVTPWAIADWHGCFGSYFSRPRASASGGLGVTIAYHVPRNHRLAPLRPDSVEAVHGWTEYLSESTALNHVRAPAHRPPSGASPGAAGWVRDHRGIRANTHGRHRVRARCWRQSVCR